MTEDIAIATMVHTLSAMTEERVAYLNQLLMGAKDFDEFRMNAVELAKIQTLLTLQNQIMRNCYELQAEAMDRIERFVNALDLNK